MRNDVKPGFPLLVLLGLRSASSARGPMNIFSAATDGVTEAA